MNDCVAIFAAVNEEIVGIKRAMNISRRVRLDKTDAWLGKWRGRDVVLVRSGVGKQRAADSALQVVNHFHPSAVISTGYAGAVQPELHVGDLVIADFILEMNGKDGGRKYFPDRNWLNRAQCIPCRDGMKAVVGGLLTVDTVIDEPAAKQKLGRSYRVQAVEMETAAIAKVAEEKRLPLLSVRVISDSVEQKLLRAAEFLGSDGEVATLKSRWYLLTHPRPIKSALSLRAQTQFATQSMTKFLSDLVS